MRQDETQLGISKRQDKHIVGGQKLNKARGKITGVLAVCVVDILVECEGVCWGTNKRERFRKRKGNTGEEVKWIVVNLTSLYKVQFPWQGNEMYYYISGIDNKKHMSIYQKTV